MSDQDEPTGLTVTDFLSEYGPRPVTAEDVQRAMAAIREFVEAVTDALRKLWDAIRKVVEEIAPWMLDGTLYPTKPRAPYPRAASVRFPHRSVPARSLRASFNYGWR